MMLKIYTNHKPIKRGYKVGIFLPSSPIKEPFRTNGLRWLERTGLSSVECKKIFDSIGYIAKDKEDILNDIKLFLEDKDIKILWAARGGYGSNYLLPELKSLIKNVKISSEKIIIGSSDVSYLLWGLLDVPEIKVFYGPMIYSSIAESKFNEYQLNEILFSNQEEIEFKGDVLIHGKCEGIITGGCLSNFVSLIGTDYIPEIENRILLLEDVNERPYSLDRMFWQIEKSGILKIIKGLILGEFPGCFIDEKEKKDFYSELKKKIKSYDIPVIINVPAGHSQKTITIPLGVNTLIDTV